MSKCLIPHVKQEVLDIVRSAVNDEKSIDVIGLGSKRLWGRPNETIELMDLSRLSQVTLYEPHELVLTADAGTPIKDIQEILAENNQQLAFEPPDLSLLYGGRKGPGTLGGIIATNLSGPRRIQSGAARDFCLGFDAISGRGDEFKSGGRVVKNVTGFDLAKLLSGSFGTLAIMVSITIKVLPISEKTRTVLIFGLDDKLGIQALSETLQGPFEVNAAAHLPTEIVENSRVSLINDRSMSVTAVRFQGPTTSVMARTEGVKNLWRSYGEVEELHSHNSAALWNEIGNVGSLLSNQTDQIWRISVPPSEGANLLVKIKHIIDCRAYFDWGGGLIWLATGGNLTEVGLVIRSALMSIGGHATLMRGSADLRLMSDVFQPQTPILSRLTKSIKDNFDPKRVLNPDRMYEGI
jgi:glycolate oxidase FAD binding subunit